MAGRAHARLRPGVLAVPVREIGRDYHWVDRLPWSIDEIRAYIDDPAITIWLAQRLVVTGRLLRVAKRPDPAASRSRTSACFDTFTAAVWAVTSSPKRRRRAWESEPTRVWLHTNTLDHPAALPNYLKRGFKVFKTENFLIDV